MRASCLFFARAREQVGTERYEFTDLPEGTSLATFRQEHLLKRFPQLQNLTFFLALDHQYVDDESLSILSERTEIAVIPPVSGG
jgi:molybdopterin converting factor small subunit